MTSVNCDRCGTPLVFRQQPRNPDARLMRHAQVPKGLCAGCSLTQFVKSVPVLDTLIAAKGPDVLLQPFVQAEIASLMAAGDADANPGEINWQGVVDWWAFPS